MKKCGKPKTDAAPGFHLKLISGEFACRTQGRSHRPQVEILKFATETGYFSVERRTIKGRILRSEATGNEYELLLRLAADNLVVCGGEFKQRAVKRGTDRAHGHEQAHPTSSHPASAFRTSLT